MTTFNARIAHQLAAALLAAKWERASLRAVIAAYLGMADSRAVGRLTLRLVKAFKSPPAPAPLAQFLRDSSLFAKPKPVKLKIVLAPPRFAPAPPFAALDIPKIATPGELAAWCELTPTELDWFADVRRLQRQTDEEPLAHYRYRFISKANGSLRLLEAPKPRLKALQQRILHEILDHAPVHDAAFGFVRRRSCIAGAARHAGERFVVCFDLKDFFLTTPVGRVYALFRALGYPHDVADRLTRICGGAVPRGLFDGVAPALRPSYETRKRFEQLHLPQGAPTSPALANLVAFRLDCRLAGLARHFDAAYSRYADDLSFSGDDRFAAQRRSFAEAVAAIVSDEGFSLNVAKTRMMGAHRPQRVTGVTVNQHVNMSREAYDRLKATLHNCLTQGASTQNRESHPQFRAHLDGRIAWLEQLNPQRGEKLRALYDRIDWTA